MNSVLIGIDLGTTGCRSVAFDEKMNILGECYIEYSLINISPKEIEQDANEWWSLTKQAIKECVQRAKIRPDMVKGISISSQGIAFVPVDKNCNPIRNAFSWLDIRASRQKERILKEYDNNYIFNITGKRINEAYVLPKLMWLKENEKHIYDRAYKFLMGHDFIIGKLCGKFVTDHTMASGTLMYDINKQEWFMDIIQGFGLDVSKLPEIKTSGTCIGRVNKETARELGISENTVVSTGGQDQKCAAFGAGIDEGIATISLGTATAITTKWDSPVIDPCMRIPCFSDLLEGKWVTEGVISTAGASLKWLKNTLFPEKGYKDLDKMVKTIDGKQNEIFFYPHLVGAGSPFWHENMKGFFYGISLSTKAGDIVKGLYEGIGYQIKANLDVTEELCGTIKELRIFGGGANSDIWCQIISDITNKKTVTLYTAETASIGAAVLAAVGSGVYKSYSDFMASQGNIKKTFHPRQDIAKTYEAKYKEYVEIQEKLAGLSKEK